MRRIAFMLLSIVLLLPSVSGYAQSLKDGCVIQMRPAIAVTTDVLDYEAACTQFRTCLQSEGHERYDLNLCQMETFDMLLAQCAVDDALCTDGAVLFAAALLVIDADPYDDLPPQTILEGVPAALSAYWQGDDETALALYTDLVQFWDFPYHNASIPLSIAVLQRRLGQSDAGFEYYTDTLDYAFDIRSQLPLGWYTRSQLFGEQGRDIEAGIEAAVLRYYFADDIDRLPSVVALQTQYPFDDTRLQDWLYYPVSINYDGGSRLGDLTLRDPIPIQVGLFPEVNQIVTFGLQSEMWREPGQQPQLWQFWTTDGTHYSHDYPYFGMVNGENPGSVGVRLEDGVLWGNETRYYPSQSVLDDDFVLAPADAPDPRETLSDTRYCEGGVISRVMVGMTVRLIMNWNPPFDSVEGEGVLLDGAPYADNPGGDMMGLVPQSSQIMITGGYECVGRVLWWQFEADDGISGWMPENVGRTYLIVPVPQQ